MGEVYRAHDARLARDVAVKILPQTADSDPDRRRRFEAEARAAGALHHPNVVVVFDTGEHEGRPYLVFELLEGLLLRQQIGVGRLSPRKAVDYAAQIAQGLAAAHEAGVVHRDLKPENVLVTRQGRVKILDFGVAKLTPALDGSPAPSDRGLATTEPGTVLGTVGYMSPEQVRGGAVDHRSDIFSLGSVLYEMLAGQRPFPGQTSSEVMASILRDDPPPLRKPGVPAGLAAVVERCLQKDPRQRFQAVADLAFALEALKGAPAAELDASVPDRDRLRRRSLSVILAVIAVAAFASVALWLGSFAGSRGSRAAPRRPLRIVPFTSFPGRELTPSFSPDGQQIAFAWDAGSDDFNIYVKRIDGGPPLRLTSRPGTAMYPAWSPDGGQLAFTRLVGSESGVFTVPALGGPERRLVTLGIRSEWYGSFASVDWSPDGKLLAFPDRPSAGEPPAIFLLSLETPSKRPLTSPPPTGLGDLSPAFSPDGRSVAFIRWSSEGVTDVYVVPVAGGEPRRVTFENRWVAGPAWTPDGREIVFSSAAALGAGIFWRIPVTGGEKEPLGIGGDTSFGGILPAPPALARQGQRLAYAQFWEDFNVWRLEVPVMGRPPGSPTKVIASTRIDTAAELSPDGRRIVFGSDRSGVSEIWTCDADGSNALQLTFLGSPLTGTPRWSPDGRRIAFDARLREASDIYVIDAEGGPPRRVTTDAYNHVVPSWSRDGRSIYFSSNSGGGTQIWKVPSDGGEAERVTRNGGFAAAESRDGRSLYYTKLDVPGLWTLPLAGGEETRVFDFPAVGYWGYWAVGERGLLVLETRTGAKPTIDTFDPVTRRMDRIASLENEVAKWESGFSLSADSRFIFYTQWDQRGSDIMLVEDFR